MAKVKLKTNAKPKTARGRDGGRERTRRPSDGGGGRDPKSKGKGDKKGKNNKNQKQEGKSSKGIILLLVGLIVAGGVGGFLFLKFREKPQDDWIVTEKEQKDLKEIDKKINNIQLDASNLRYVIADTNSFLETYSVPQFIMKDEQKIEFTCPNLEPVQKIKDDAVEGLASKTRVDLREQAYKDLLAKNQEYLNDQDRIKREQAVADQVKDLERKREELEKKVMDQMIADGATLDRTKDTVRWAILDEEMFDRSLFKPLDGRYVFNFVQAGKKFLPWMEYKLQKQALWGRGMRLILDSAMNTFEILSNSGTDHLGWVMNYEKRKGFLRGITIDEFKIKVIDNIEGQEIPKTLTRPIIDIPPDEFYKLCHKAVIVDKLQNSLNAKKKWAELKKLHPTVQDDEQILKFGFASLMYCLKQFPSAREKIKEITEIDTKLLSDEIDIVEPTFDRREMTIAMKIAQDLYDDGFRQDSLMILNKMKERFGTEPSKQWSEFSDIHDELYQKALKLKKR